MRRDEHPRGLLLGQNGQMPARLPSPSGMPDDAARARTLMASVSRVDVMRFLNANGRSNISQILEGTDLKANTARKALGELEQLGFVTADIPVGARSGFVVHYEPNTKEITVALMAFTSWFIGRND
jgi:DNA-binding transcriptional ArsR family regulator